MILRSRCTPEGENISCRDPSKELQITLRPGDFVQGLERWPRYRGVKSDIAGLGAQGSAEEGTNWLRHWQNSSSQCGGHGT